MLPRLIAITRDRIFVLEVHKFRMGVGIVKSNHSVAEVSAVVLRTTSKDTVGLKLRHSPKTSGEYTRTFTMEQPAEFLKAMREATAAKTSTASSIMRKWF